MFYPEGIFDGYGVYEYSGLGAVQCPAGQMEFPEGSGLCVPTISTPTMQCGPGTSEPWPGAGFCVPSTGGSLSPSSGTTAGSTCPAGMIGIPPHCFPITGEPTATPVLPGPCPAGTIGIPPNCFPLPAGTSLPAIPGTAQPIPVPVPAPAPAPAPAPELPPPPPAPSATPSELPKWVVPAAVGAGVLFIGMALMKPSRRAVANRSRRRRRAR